MNAVVILMAITLMAGFFLGMIVLYKCQACCRWANKWRGDNKTREEEKTSGEKVLCDVKVQGPVTYVISPNGDGRFKWLGNVSYQHVERGDHYLKSERIRSQERYG